MTVRRAINILVQQGLVSTTQGLGTFVKPVKLSTVMFGLEELRGLFDRNVRNKVKLLEVSIVKAGPDIASRLALSPGDRVILSAGSSIRKRSQSFTTVNTWFTTLTPDCRGGDGGNGPPRPVRGDRETSLKRGELAIDAAVLGDEEAHLLMAPPGLPSFRLEHLFYDFDNRPISWGFFLCRGDLMRFSATVGLTDKPKQRGRKPGGRP